MSKNNDPLFKQHEHALEKEYGICPDCGSELQIKNSKAGAFIGCANYPSCTYSRPLVEHEKFEGQVLANTECPDCGNELAVKQGRYGMFIGCTNFPECHFIDHDEAQALEDVCCPKCATGHLVEKHNRFGKTFFACTNYPKCKFVVNHPPVAGQCEKCGFTLLLRRQMAAGEKDQCADKKCAHFQKQS
ncbi:topoisomerase DNA-binding C4 zinc finger domain-containing protein [Thalassotalea aquiviva]|uniref:DNA topoisomerase family protein n=1 Tax=Thalassotalea aquiviva TaxID=3242415 RepID=UPI00352B11C1